MPDRFDTAIDSLRAITLESAPKISLTLDLTGFGTGTSTAGEQRDRTDNLTITHRPDGATESETQAILDVLTLLAQAS